MERKNAVTVKGNPLTLFGDEIKTGQRAPEFKTVNTDLKEVSSDEYKGKLRLIASVPSLDTPVCDLEIKRFNKEAVGLSSGLIIIFISMDLPFAQKRFCQANEIRQVRTLSDHRDADFGLKYGVLIKELRLLARAVFVVDRNGIIQYISLVKEIAEEPDYDAVLAAVKKLT